jgi:hypothetical protein
MIPQPAEQMAARDDAGPAVPSGVMLFHNEPGLGMCLGSVRDVEVAGGAIGHGSHGSRCRTRQGQG